MTNMIVAQAPSPSQTDPAAPDSSTNLLVGQTHAQSDGVSHGASEAVQAQNAASTPATVTPASPATIADAPSTAPAMDGAPSDAAPADLAMGAIEQIRAVLDMGGPVVMLLAVLSVLSLTVILYKLWQFSWIGIGRHKRARSALTLWRNGQKTDAIALLSKGKSPVTVVLLHAMRGQLFHPEQGDLVREDVDRVALKSLSKTRFLLRFLETVGQISPLLGLFGTVIGMIEAFQKLQQAGATVDPSVLAGGIWVALLTTAVGLAVAIPASLFADWFTSRVEREQEVIEELVTSVLTGQITDISSIPEGTGLVGETAYAT